MNLPQELLDQVFSFIRWGGARYDRQSFSLVSRSWLECSRRRYFSHITIDTRNYERFLDAVSPTNTALLAHVHSLTCFVQAISRYRDVRALEDYLPSLSQLQRLTFCNMTIIPGCLGLFSAFRHTLSSLTLKEDSIAWNTFVSLVGYFPNLRNLEISNCSVDDQPAPHPPRPLYGRLSLRSYSPLLSGGLHLTNRLTELQIGKLERALLWYPRGRSGQHQNSRNC